MTRLIGLLPQMMIVIQLLSCAFIPCQVLAQCPSGGVIFTQSQIDNFSQDYPNCTHFDETVQFYPSVSSLAGLSQLEHIKNLTIRNTNLTNLDGLENLHSIGRFLDIVNNLYLDTILLPSLQVIEDSSGSTGFCVIALNPIVRLIDFPQLLESKILTICGSNDLRTIEFDSLTRADDVYIYKNPVVQKFYAPNLNEFDDFIFTNLLGGASDINAGVCGEYAWPVLHDPGIVIINNSYLNQLTFNAPDSVDGWLKVVSNHGLTNIDMFQSITHVDWAIELNNNDNLIEIGLENLESVNGALRIWNNYSATEALFPNLEKIGWDVSLWNNEMLSSFDIGTVDSINNLYIQRQHAFVNLQSFNQIQHIKNDLWISENDLLQSLDGLDSLSFANLSNVNHQLQIYNNAQLIDISALENLQPNMPDEDLEIVRIKNNPRLSECDIAPICEFLSVQLTDSIYNNAIGCQSAQEVMDSCLVNGPDTTDSDPCTIIEIYLLEGAPIDAGLYQAIDKLFAAGYVAAPDSVMLVASQSIELQAEFEVNLGAELNVFIDDCVSGLRHINEEDISRTTPLPSEQRLSIKRQNFNSKK